MCLLFSTGPCPLLWSNSSLKPLLFSSSRCHPVSPNCLPFTGSCVEWRRVSCCVYFLPFWVHPNSWVSPVSFCWNGSFKDDMYLFITQASHWFLFFTDFSLDYGISIFDFVTCFSWSFELVFPPGPFPLASLFFLFALLSLAIKCKSSIIFGHEPLLSVVFFLAISSRPI